MSIGYGAFLMIRGYSTTSYSYGITEILITL